MNSDIVADFFEQKAVSQITNQRQAEVAKNVKTTKRKDKNKVNVESIKKQDLEPPAPVTIQKGKKTLTL